MATCQNAILAKCQSPKSLHFFMNFSETFRIDVNMDFANNLVRDWYMSRPTPQPIGRSRVFEIERPEPP